MQFCKLTSVFVNDTCINNWLFFAVIKADHGETAQSENKRKSWAAQDAHPGCT